MTKKNIIISGLHLELTDALKAATEEKLEKLFEHQHPIESIRVDLKHNPHSATHRNEFVAQGHIHTKGKTLIVTEKGDELYHAINAMAEKLDRQLRKLAHRKEHARNHPHSIDLACLIPKASD